MSVLGSLLPPSLMQEALYLTCFPGLLRIENRWALHQPRRQCASRAQQGRGDLRYEAGRILPQRSRLQQQRRHDRRQAVFHGHARTAGRMLLPHILPPHHNAGRDLGCRRRYRRQAPSEVP